MAYDEDVARREHGRWREKPMRGFVYVSPPGFADDGGMDGWVRRGVDFALSLPPK